MTGAGERSWLRRMASECTIAARYLRSSRRDASILFLSRMTAAGIALGVAALVLAMAGLAGLQSRLLDDARRRTPDLQVLIADGEATQGRLLRDEIAALEEVQSVRELHVGQGWLRIGDSLEPVEVVGFEGPAPYWMPEPSVAVDTLDGVLLPRRIVSRLGLSTGSVVELVSPRQRLGPLGPQPSTSYQRVLGTYDSGKDETRRQQAAVSVEVARRLFGDHSVTLDVVGGEGVGERRVVEAVLSVVAGRGELVRWQDRNRGLLFVLRLEKTLVFLAVALIVLVGELRSGFGGVDDRRQQAGGDRHPGHRRSGAASRSSPVYRARWAPRRGPERSSAAWRRSRRR